MKTFGFIGAYDKSDLILYISRILTLAGKKVLIVDATSNQKMRYIIPSIIPTKTYVTEFQNIDIAVGFENLDGIKNYFGIDNKSLEYDLIFIDIDNVNSMVNYDITKNYKNLFVTDFDIYSLKKGMEILSILKNDTKFIKVLFSKDMLEEENRYLDYISENYPIVWEKRIFYFPLEIGNYAVKIENQVVSRIKYKGLSNGYMENLQYLIESIFENEISSKDLNRIIKNLEREA